MLNYRCTLCQRDHVAEVQPNFCGGCSSNAFQVYPVAEGAAPPDDKPKPAPKRDHHRE